LFQFNQDILPVEEEVLPSENDDMEVTPVGISSPFEFESV